MAQVLDAIVVKDVLGTRNANNTYQYESINIDGNSESIDVSVAETGYLVDVQYANGSTPNIDFVVQISSDNINWANYTATLENVTDNSGSIIIDVVDSNVNYVRVGWVVNSGSVDAQITIFGRRRH